MEDWVFSWGQRIRIVVVQNTISPTQLRGIVYEIYIISRNLVAGLHVEIVQHVGCFTDGVQKTKMSIQLINKKILIGEPVLQDILVFLIEAHLKLVLSNFYKVGYYKVDFYNVHIKLHGIGVKVEVILKQEIIELVRLNTVKSVSDAGFGFP